MIPTAVTVARTRPWQYQVTYWDDGVARWDATTGPRLGAWQSTVDPVWFERVARLAGDLPPVKKPGKGDLTLIIEADHTENVHNAIEGKEPEAVWLLALLVDGMTTRTAWAPLDMTGEADFAPWAQGLALSLAQRGCFAQAVGRPEGLVVLAGSQLATSTSPSLEGFYEHQRAHLLETGALVLQGDRFLLTRHLRFEAPSAAASVITGSNTNGRKEWRDGTGRPWADFGWGTDRLRQTKQGLHQRDLHG